MKLIRNTETDRFEFLCTFNEKHIPKSARFRWDPEAKRWWTDDVNKALKLKDYADGEVLVSELEALDGKKKSAREASRSVDLDIDVPSPKGLNYMPFQRAGIGYAMSREHVLIADEMGLGKTIQALGIVNTTPEAKRVLVVCPASLRLNWKQEAERWLVNSELEPKVIDAKNPITGDENFLIINYDILSKNRNALKASDWDIMIVDEAHYLKNPKAQRTKALLGEKGKGGINATRKVFLTGTPIVNRPIEFHPILASIAPTEFGNFFAYTKRYCDAYQNEWGWDFTGASNLDELQDRLRETCMVRRLKVDVLTELPAKRRAVIEIPANGKIRYINAEMKALAAHEDVIAKLRAAVELTKASEKKADYEAAVGRLKAVAQTHFTEMSALRKETAIAKAPLVATHVRDAVEAGNKVVVFAHHHEVIDTLMLELDDLGCVKLDGRDAMEARNDAVNTFQEDEDVNVFVGGIQAAGVGLTLTASSHVIFAELDWVPGNISQAEDRCHRIGQADQVMVQHLVFEGSIDVNIARTLVRKQAVIDQALDAENEEPVVPIADEKPAVSVRKRQLAKDAAKLTPEKIAKVHSDLKLLASLCDGANAIDGMGFNKIDSYIGKSLADAKYLTPKQAALGQKLTRKYHRQLTITGE